LQYKLRAGFRLEDFGFNNASLEPESGEAKTDSGAKNSGAKTRGAGLQKSRIPARGHIYKA
jgi:hypothetical protein